VKFAIANFRGILPILDNTKLPDQMASVAVNTKLTSGAIEGYLDIGNPFQLAKPPTIFTLELADNNDWLQFTEAELASFAYDILCIHGIIPGDVTGRRYITGYNALTGGTGYPNTGVFQGVSPNSVPQFTNTFFATDPSQQGTALAGAFPYKTFPLGIADPSDSSDPNASAPADSGTTTNYDSAQETYVQSATISPGAVGTGYVVGDTPFIAGGTYPTGFTQALAAAQLTVTSIGANGSITGLSTNQNGFYLTNEGPGGSLINESAGYNLPVSTINILSTVGWSPSGSINVNNTGGVIQTIAYSAISGNQLTGCTGGSGTIANLTPAQATTITANLIGGSGSGATVQVNVVPQQTVFVVSGSPLVYPNGWGFVPFNNGASDPSFGSFVAPIGLNGLGRATQQWNIENGQGSTYIIYSTTAFSLKTASSFLLQVDAISEPNTVGGYADLVFQFAGTFNGAAPEGQVVGPTLVIQFNEGVVSLYQSITPTNEAPVAGSPIASTAYPFAGGSQYRVSITGTANSSSTTPGYNISATVALSSNPTSILATLTGFVPYSGEQFGIGTNNRNGITDAFFENVLIQVTQPASDITVESTNYVYTYVQNIPGDPLTQESGPSNPSATIDVDINGTTNPATRATATVIIPPSPSGENIAYYNLYRLVEDTAEDETYTFVTQLAAFNITGASGSFDVGETVTGGTSGATATVLSYAGGILELSGVTGVFAVGETLTGGTSGATGVYASSALSSVSITYEDSAQDSVIGPAVLISQTWGPPPANMQGIIAFPNGIMGGFFDNVFCLSAQNFPHAWPVDNQYATDTNITSATPIDTTGLLTTESYPYTAWGTDPSAFNMSKEVSIQGCVATRGVATHKKYGVLFPSGNGYCYYKGQGLLDLVRITELEKPPFSYEQWRALVPSSIIACLHDDYLFWFYNNGTTKSGFVLDLTPNGFGLHQLDFHATCLYVNKSNDTLFIVPDYSVDPIPAGGSVIATAQNVVSQWEAAATYRNRTWTRNDKLYGYAVGFQRARIQSGGSGTINFTAFSEIGTAFDGAVNQKIAFIMKPQPGLDWGVSLAMTGSVKVTTLAMAESVEELTVQPQ
jgi:hypothetical protein